MKKCMYPVVGLILLAAAVHAENLLTNESFEVMDSTTPSDWSGMSWTSTNAAHEWWASRHGTNGAAFYGWETAYWDSRVYQDVSVTAGVYSFTIWARRESGFNANAIQLMLEWYDDASNAVQAASVADWTGLPNDGYWHQLYVTGTGTVTNISFVRVMAYAQWTNSGGGGTALMMDDAQLYSGSYTGTPGLWNGGFEEPGHQYWRSSQWQMEPEGVGGNLENWAWRSGSWGIGLWGWSSDQDAYTTRFFQCINPQPGTNTFRVWVRREPEFLLTNMNLTIEWYDRTLTNKLCTDSVTNLTVPNDNSWHEYHVTGVCNSNALYEARPVIFVQYNYNSNSGARGMKIDDARFHHGEYFAYTGGIETAWGYHGAPGYAPGEEQVPATPSPGAFLQPQYGSTTTVFYVLANHPSVARREDETGRVGLRIWYWNSEQGNGVETYAWMEQVTNIILEATNAFHGSPSSGSVTVDVYRYEWQQPLSTNNTPLDEPITVYYSPYFESWYGDMKTDPTLFLVWTNGETVNNYAVDPQLFSTNYMDRDYSYTNDYPTIWSSLTNGSFEKGADPNSLSDTGWEWQGAAGRSWWAAHSGGLGAYFAGWESNGVHTCALYQNVGVTGGTWTFEVQVVAESGFNPTSFEAAVEWYATDLVTVLHRDSTNLLGMARDTWNHVVVESTWAGDAAAFARVLVRTRFLGPTGTPASVKIDDARFFQGPYVDAVNTDWGYHNSGTNAAADEQVPGGYGSFLQVNYSTTTTTFYVLANWSSVAGRTDETGEVGLRTCWQDPLTPSVWYENYSAMSWVANEVLSSTDQFHGSPAAGSVTVDVWKVDWTQPLDTNGVPYTNAITVFYAPYFKTVYGDVQTGFKYLVHTNGTANNYNDDPQLFSDDYMYKDYSYVNTYYSPDSDGDGMPDAWEQRYFGGPTNADAGTDSDGDGAVNLDEYIADTVPTNASSYFESAVTNTSGHVVVNMIVGPPTTNSRVYDAWWNTNLMGSGWYPFNLDVPGNADGSALTLTVTNMGSMRFYRTGVKVP